MTRDVARVSPPTAPLSFGELSVTELAYRVLMLPSVASKSFLITIGDRSVTGLIHRDQLVGPHQVPVSDVAVTLADYVGYSGEAMAIGERTPLAILDAAASARMAVGEALTNLASAKVGKLEKVKLSANWMAAAGTPGEDARLYEAVRAVGMELCPALGLTIPVGKDSMSMRTVWEGGKKSVTAPVSLIVSAFASIEDVVGTLTPELKKEPGATELLVLDLGRGRNRMGLSAAAQVTTQVGESVPDVDSAEDLRAFFAFIQEMNAKGLLLAYHDRSDGGLFATLAEMCFAGRCGIAVDLDALPGTDVTSKLFAEELGAVLQIRATDRDAIFADAAAMGVSGFLHVLGTPTADARVRIRAEGKVVLDESRASLETAWADTSFRIQSLRNNPKCAAEEFERIKDELDPGIAPVVTFDPTESRVRGFIESTSERPKIAIFREQGVNGQIEMAAAFHAAGFAAHDVHMSDLKSGAVSLDAYRGLVACGGFSYGDVLGAGQGWAKSILFDAKTREALERFFRRSETFSLGVCNGCQMMSGLKGIIPGAEAWPRFLKNESEQFEARVAQLLIEESPSLFFRGMAGSRIPVAVAHGEGRVRFEPGDREKAVIAARFVDGRGRVTTHYPENPNGSVDGITSLTTTDGRVTILMPHPERVFRVVQHSYAPPSWSGRGPWLRFFENAREFVG